MTDEQQNNFDRYCELLKATLEGKQVEETDSKGGWINAYFRELSFHDYLESESDQYRIAPDPEQLCRELVR